jgi:hypothetical protein
MPVAPDVSLHVRAALLARVDGGTVLIGTTDSLARAFGVTVAVLLSALRELIEAGRITVQMEPRGQISVCLADRPIGPAGLPV